MTLLNFIKKRPYLFWSVSAKDYEHLSKEAVVEAVLNHGDFSDVKKMISILGLKKTAAIFRKKSSQKRCNYRPEIKNYFKLYFDKYA